jgi:hypothetical protein
MKAFRSFKANLREVYVIGLADGGRALGSLRQKGRNLLRPLSFEETRSAPRNAPANG